jgi:hypothetical protein
MAAVESTRFLHVTNGTCTTGLIEAAGIPGALSIWADPLYEGPVPGGVTDTELLEVRARHLADGLEPAEVDGVNDPRLWRRMIERHDSYDELILWFEHDLFDQLNLIQLLTFIDQRLPGRMPVSLVCIGSFPGHPHFKGLGELRPGDLPDLFEARQGVEAPQYALADDAWRLFRQSEPEGIDRLRRSDTSALPFLAAALKRLLQEYPWTMDGLSRSERRLLRLAEGGPLDLAGAFPRMHDDESAYYITDLSLIALVETLSRTMPPLISFAPPATDSRPHPKGTVALTDTGQAVVAGRLDRVAECGIDRWIGGVHLQGRGEVWRWDEQHDRVRPF